MRVPIVCTVHVRIQLAYTVHNNQHTSATYATYVEYIGSGAEGSVRVRAHAFIYGRSRESAGPDAVIRRNRASSQQQRVSRRESQIYIRNFRSLTANMLRLPACLRPVVHTDTPVYKIDGHSLV